MISPRIYSKNDVYFAMQVHPTGKPEDFRFCVAEGSNPNSLFELRRDEVKNYDFSLRRLDSEALHLLQY